MRITGGRAKGRVIRRKVEKGVRPTSSRVREALFSILGQDLAGQTVLDAFGGSGLLGLEAWSRGATVTVVEKRAFVAKTLRETGKELGADWEVLVGDVFKVAPQKGPWTGVLADPPYHMDPASLLPSLIELSGEWLVYEARSDRKLPSRVGDHELVRERRFGESTLWVYEVISCEE